MLKTCLRKINNYKTVLCRKKDLSVLYRSILLVQLGIKN
jgi:hypothetical protein